MNAAQSLVATLVRHGVDRIFCVPGESFLAVLDALYDERSIDVVACRHEGGAGLMAVADTKLTGRPAVEFVSRGPGAGNAALALHVAQQDAAPLVLFVGQVERKDLGRGAFQEADYRKSFGGLCKGVWEVDRGEALPGVCAQAFALAAGGIPGPVLVSLPEDMLLDASGPAAQPLPLPCAPSPRAEAVRRAAELLSKAERPVAIVGSALHQSDVELLVRVSDAFRLPVALGWKQQHRFPNRHPHYAGHLGYNIPAKHLEMLSPADLVLALGSRLGDVTTQGYRFPRAPEPAQPLVHVHPASEALQRLYRTALPIHADCGEFLRALLEHAPADAPERDAWIGRTHGYVEALMRWKDEPAEDGVDFGAVAAALDELLPADAIMTHDAGNLSTWAHRYVHFRGTQTLLAIQAGAMGFGVPAAVAASLRHPQRKAVCLVGDGGMLMTGNELATAIQHGAKPLVLISNNSCYGTIRLYQEQEYPGRVKATSLRNPDFVALARAFGADAWRIDSAQDVIPVLRQALDADRAAVVEVRSSLSHISAFRTFEGIRSFP